MASGSQTNSGICADLPAAPIKSSNVINVIVAGLKHLHMLLQLDEIQSPHALAAQLGDQKKIPRMKPKSPMRLTMNALLPAMVLL